ncbi:MAG: hypothetical protein OFPII_07630 [Osedax symbiont Rs1]|nr:MAG: hypothetical protein OFPII_07630 [Osedax symbiont Rs1]
MLCGFTNYYPIAVYYRGEVVVLARALSIEDECVNKNAGF